MENISAYIVAGGKSARMGSDKGLLLLREKTFVSHIVKALQDALVSNITIVSTNDAYDFLNCNRIEDIYPEKGPVGGIFTALSHSKTEQNIILSVDVPLISSNIISWLISKNDKEKLITQLKVRDKTNPLLAIYNKKGEHIFEENVIKNQLKLRSVVEKIPHQTIDVPEEWCDLLKNINTKEDYQNILKMTITLKYFGLIAEITNTNEELFSFEKSDFTTHDLLEKLHEKYTGLNAVSFEIAVNKSIVSTEITLKNNDIIALLPPFAGG